MNLKAAGLRARYLPEYLATGEAPEDGAVFRQRSRWCKGHLQALFSRRDCPLLRSGLSLTQRLLYSSGAWAYAAAALTTPALASVPIAALAFDALPFTITPRLACAFVPYFAAVHAVVYWCDAPDLLRALWFGGVATRLLWWTYLKALVNTALWSLGLKRRMAFKTTAKAGVEAAGSVGGVGRRQARRDALQGGVVGLDDQLAVAVAALDLGRGRRPFDLFFFPFEAGGGCDGVLCFCLHARPGADGGLDPRPVGPHGAHGRVSGLGRRRPAPRRQRRGLGGARRLDRLGVLQRATPAVAGALRVAGEGGFAAGRVRNGDGGVRCRAGGCRGSESFFFFFFFGGFGFFFPLSLLLLFLSPFFLTQELNTQTKTLLNNNNNNNTRRATSSSRRTSAASRSAWAADTTPEARACSLQVRARGRPTTETPSWA